MNMMKFQSVILFLSNSLPTKMDNLYRCSKNVGRFTKNTNRILRNINKKLTTKDKKELCADSGMIDVKGRKIGWTRMKQVIEDLGYSVKGMRTNSERYTIIS